MRSPLLGLGHVLKGIVFITRDDDSYYNLESWFGAVGSGFRALS